MHRRKFFYRLGAVVATAGGLYGYATRVEPFWVQITQRSLAIKNLPSTLHGKKLVQISDLHIGCTDLDYLRRAIELTNTLAGDIVVITGDVIDHQSAQINDGLRRLLSRLQPGTIATLSCLGNHDYGDHWSQRPIANAVTSELRDLGFQVLRNEHTDVAGLQVFGLDDLWSPNYRPEDVLSAARPEIPSLCLCHNPDVCDEPVWGDFQGPILAGHTHGGQCKPPFFRPPRLPVRNRNYVSGFYDLSLGRTLYINRGLGYGFQARFNCFPEITCFSLVPAEMPAVSPKESKNRTF